jgi:hypothetical protein
VARDDSSQVRVAPGELGDAHGEQGIRESRRSVHLSLT